MLRGPDYLRFMRQKLIKARVKVIDHCPVAELLVSDGAVAGAIARFRRSGKTLEIRSGAVVIATGGCAFLSGALGTNNLTGDGYLIAAEAGAVLSGMEFSAQYGISPAYSSVTKGVVYFWKTFSDAQGNILTAPGDRQSVVGSELIRGPVYAILDKASPRLQEGFRRGQPNIFVPFDRMGIDPFTERFPITLRHEGTVRGTGGSRWMTGLRRRCLAFSPRETPPPDRACRAHRPVAADRIRAGRWRPGHGLARTPRSMSARLGRTGERGQSAQPTNVR